MALEHASELKPTCDGTRVKYHDADRIALIPIKTVAAGAKPAKKPE